MLTVKYIAPDGDEQVFAVQAVRKTNRKAASSDSPFADVTFDRPPGSGPGLLQVSNGCVYVMNEFGKTVATYDLGLWNDPPSQLNTPVKQFAQIGGDPNVYR